VRRSWDEDDDEDEHVVASKKYTAIADVDAATYPMFEVRQMSVCLPQVTSEEQSPNIRETVKEPAPHHDVEKAFLVVRALRRSPATIGAK